MQVLGHVADVPAALAELHRVLRPGGRVLVWDVEWSTLSWYSVDPERVQRVLRAFGRHLAHPALPRTLAASLRAAGFTGIDTAGHAFVTTEPDPKTFGGMALPRVEQYLAEHDDIDRAEAAAWIDVTFVGASVVLALLVLVASLVPAWRATRVDPIIALRCD